MVGGSSQGKTCALYANRDAVAISYNFHNGPFENYKSGKFIKMLNCLMLAVEPRGYEQ